MTDVEWVVYLIGDNGDGKVVEYLRGNDEALDGTEIPVSLLSKNVVIRIEQQVKE